MVYEEINQPAPVPFQHLSIGEEFLHNTQVYVKIRPVTVNNIGGYNAFSLREYFVVQFGNASLVYRVKGKYTFQKV